MKKNETEQKRQKKGKRETEKGDKGRERQKGN
jgi:hypothetical protein